MGVATVLAVGLAAAWLLREASRSKGSRGELAKQRDAIARYDASVKARRQEFERALWLRASQSNTGLAVRDREEADAHESARQRQDHRVSPLRLELGELAEAAALPKVVFELQSREAVAKKRAEEAQQDQARLPAKISTLNLRLDALGQQVAEQRALAEQKRQRALAEQKRQRALAEQQRQAAEQQRQAAEQQRQAAWQSFRAASGLDLTNAGEQVGVVRSTAGTDYKEKTIRLSAVGQELTASFLREVKGPTPRFEWVRLGPVESDDLQELRAAVAAVRPIMVIGQKVDGQRWRVHLPRPVPRQAFWDLTGLEPMSDGLYR